VGRVSFTLLGSGGSWFVFMFGSAFMFTFDRGPAEAGHYDDCQARTWLLRMDKSDKPEP
jgi:hypothetical protein